MKNAKSGLTAVLLSVAFAATSFAATAAGKVLHTSGKISAVDASASTVTISVAGKAEKIDYTAATAILEEGKNVAATALVPGEKVKIAFEEKAGKNVATSIEIFKVATPAAATKSK